MHIAILGAGLSGLATGWFLKQLLGSDIRLTIIEKNQHVGGWIQTIQKEGFLFELGPHSCRSKGAGLDVLALIEALNLQDQILLPHPSAKNRYVYNGKNLQRIPRHLWEIPFNSLTRDWLKVIWRDWRMPVCQEKDESIESFFHRRIGSSWTEKLIDPFVSGVYAGDCRRLSLKSCFPLFHEWERQEGSLLRGAWRHRSTSAHSTPFIQHMRRFPMFTFCQGMQTLPLALAQQLKDHLILGQSVKHLKFQSQHIEIELENGENIKADQVISTLPLFSLSSLLVDYPLLAAKLNEVSYATVAVVNVGFNQSVLPLNGFGYLISSQLRLPILGCIWDSSIFPQQNVGNQTRLTVMMGGIHHPEIEQMAESELIEYALQGLREHVGIKSQPQVVQVQKAQRAIPQFEVGYAHWKQEVLKAFDDLPSLIVSGSAWTGVSIPDCVSKARDLASNLMIKILQSY